MKYMKDELAAFVNRSQDDWDEYVKCIPFWQNTSVHKTTGFTPFMVVHGQECRLPLETWFGHVDDLGNELSDYDAFVQKIQYEMADMNDNRIENRCRLR